MAGRQPEYCGNCGARLEPHNIYCVKCGQRIQDFILSSPRGAWRPIVWIPILIVVFALAGIAVGGGWLSSREATACQPLAFCVRLRRWLLQQSFLRRLSRFSSARHERLSQVRLARRHCQRHPHLHAHHCSDSYSNRAQYLNAHLHFHTNAVAHSVMQYGGRPHLCSALVWGSSQSHRLSNES